MVLIFKTYWHQTNIQKENYILSYLVAQVKKINKKCREDKVHFIYARGIHKEILRKYSKRWNRIKKLIFMMTDYL